MEKSVVIIAGPTASGKSRLALDLAQAVHGDIINADSMQLYAPYPILTAQPDKDERAAVPHHLYGAIAPPALGSAAWWRDEAIKCIDETFRQNRTPILVGGTGLYLEALMHGLSPMPNVPEEIRNETKALHEKLGATSFHEKLATVDPETAARLPAGDTQRLIRAYEIYSASGKPISHWQKQPLQTPPAHWQFSSILLQPLRATLNNMIDARFKSMLKKGALDEVNAARILPMADDHPARKAIGCRELEAVLDRKLTVDEAIAQAQTATRHYAKRQNTWFKNRFLKREHDVGRPVTTLEKPVFNQALQRHLNIR